MNKNSEMHLRIVWWYSEEMFLIKWNRITGMKSLEVCFLLFSFTWKLTFFFFFAPTIQTPVDITRLASCIVPSSLTLVASTDDGFCICAIRFYHRWGMWQIDLKLAQLWEISWCASWHMLTLESSKLLLNSFLSFAKREVG